MYNISTASELSGVPAETIRIWERRYSAVTPRRTAGGHRKYSDDDVAMLSALKSLVEQGGRIGKVVAMGREAILAQAGPPAADADPVAYDGLMSEIILAAQASDTVALGRLLDRPLLHRHGAEVALNLFLPVLRTIGEMWHDGELDISVEHMVERQITARLNTVILNRRPTKDGPRAVLACLPGERHEVGLLTAALILTDAGFTLTYLGADLPIAEIVRTVADTRPRLIVLAATIAPAESDLASLHTAYRAPAFRQASIVVGGGAAGALESEHAVAVPLDRLAETAHNLLNAS